MEKEYTNLKYYGIFKIILKVEVCNKQIFLLK